jgi:hypothetical protein
LPIYVGAMAHASIIDWTTLEATPRFIGDHSILQCFDLYAVEDDVAKGLSSYGGNDQLSSSSHLALGCTSSFHLGRNCSESSTFDFAN